jgi:hypothetical protein
MTDRTKAAGGRGETAAQAQRHAELMRSLVERTAKGPPSARRRAIALASVRVAQTIESQRGKA